MGQLDVARPSVMRARLAVAALALAAMAHVGSPDTFFAGDAGPYHVRVSVRLPGVIPGRAQIVVRVPDAKPGDAYRVTVRAGQWNVGLDGAPPPDAALPVPGDPTLFSTELWFMTPTSYQVLVNVEGPSGGGKAVVPVVAFATAERTMGAGLGIVLAGLGVFLGLGLLTIIGAAVRESVLAPGVAPDARHKRRGRFAIAGTAIVVALAMWGGRVWWQAEAASYGSSVLYRPFASQASIATTSDRSVLTLSIRDPRWTGHPPAVGRYSALMPDHGKLMHLFAIREPGLDAFAHLHPIARTAGALDFDATLPALPPGHYRLYADIVHESGYVQTLVSGVDVARAVPHPPSDPDDSAFVDQPSSDDATGRAAAGDAPAIVWTRDPRPLVSGEERLLAFSARDASGQPLDVEPYMGMAAHLAITNADGSVFVHLHPAGSISMAAMQRFTRDSGLDRAMPMHGDHMAMSSGVSIPYAFPKPGRYRMWVQMKHAGRVLTAPFDADVR